MGMVLCHFPMVNIIEEVSKAIWQMVLESIKPFKDRWSRELGQRESLIALIKEIECMV